MPIEPTMTIELGEDYAFLREPVRRICEKFPGEYWRKLDAKAEYPHEFVDALTEHEVLAALIPEQYGGSGLPLRAASVILETIHSSGCNAAACHAQMYTMGTVLRHGSDEQKNEYLPKIATGELRLQAFAVTEPATGSDTTQLKTRAVRDGDEYVINGQKLWTSECCNPISCCCSRAPLPPTRSPNDRRACRPFSSICERPKATASRSSCRRRRRFSGLRPSPASRPSDSPSSSTMICGAWALWVGAHRSRVTPPETPSRAPPPVDGSLRSSTGSATRAASSS